MHRIGSVHCEIRLLNVEKNKLGEHDKVKGPHINWYHGLLSTSFTQLYPPIRLLYGKKRKAAISMPFNLHCKAIAALFFILYCHPI